MCLGLHYIQYTEKPEKEWQHFYFLQKKWCISVPNRFFLPGGAAHSGNQDGGWEGAAQVLPMEAGSKKVTYSRKDFHFSISNQHGQPNKSEFDVQFLRTWNMAVGAEVFRYSVEGVETRVLPGKYNIVTQMNAERKAKKRQPGHTDVSEVKQPFEQKHFNFKKIKSEEKMLHLEYVPDSSEATDSGDDTQRNSVHGSLVINNAPICQSHSLLVPSLDQCLQQVVTFPGLKLALHTLLLSQTPDLRVAYNSIGGCATVNHFHFHTYYLKHKLYIETADCVQLAGPCFELKDFYSQGFVFHLENNDIDLLARRVMKLIKLLVEENVAHNLYLTRGSSLSMEGEPGDSEEYDTIRVIVWPREFDTEEPEIEMFALACCELAGHVPVYLQNKWASLTEDDVIEPLHSVCKKKYAAIRPRVVSLFTHEDSGSTV